MFIEEGDGCYRVWSNPGHHKDSHTWGHFSYANLTEAVFKFMDIVQERGLHVGEATDETTEATDGGD